MGYNENGWNSLCCINGAIANADETGLALVTHTAGNFCDCWQNKKTATCPGLGTLLGKPQKPAEMVELFRHLLPE